MSDPPRVLVELGCELERAARRTLSTRSRGRWLWRLSPAIVVVLVLLLAAVAAAAVLLITEGNPLPAPHAADLSPWEDPVPGSVRLAGLDAPDPAGGPVWDIRLSRSRTGETCTAVGQVFRGKFGIIGLDHVFRALPVGGVDACGVPGIAGPVLAGARVFAGRTPDEARTVVNGIAGAGARSVTAYGPGAPRRLRLGPQGSFITVYRGYVQDVRPRIVVVDSSGRSHTIAFASSTAFESSDPDGGAPWQISGGADIESHGALPDENCAQVSQEAGPASPGPLDSPLTPTICGPLGKQPLFVSMRRFDPGDGEDSGTPWGHNPPRTLVYGAASLRVKSLTLLGGGAPRTLAIDPHGGVFLAVLDGRTDPRSLTLLAKLRDGQTVRYTHSTALFSGSTGKPIVEHGVQPYRPLSSHEPRFQPLEDPISSTVRETEQAPDPAGGAPWVLRSWRGHVDSRARFGSSSHPTMFTCSQAGVLKDGRLVEPVPGASPITLTVSDPSLDAGDTNCQGIGGPPAEELHPTIDTYAANPSAYAPRPAQTVITGVIPPNLTDPVLLGAGPPRALQTDANHAYLIVLPGSYWRADLRVSARQSGGRTVTSTAESHGPIMAPEVRAPDPDGSAPWGFTQTALCPRSWSISEIGRIVEGQINTLIPATGQLAPGPGETETGSPCSSKNARAQQRSPENSGPLRLDVDVLQATPQAAPAPTQAEIERRTLPGDTVIAGSADPDVVSITLTTPQDVRTVRPLGAHHVFLVVYDGIFYRGTFTATVKLTDGHTQTVPIPGASANPQGQPRPILSLAAQLRSDKTTLRHMRAQVSRASHADPALRGKLLDGVPLSMLLRGLRQIRSAVEQLTARIAYERTHPGVLPAE